MAKAPVAKGARTCVGCGTQAAKTAFARIVRRPDGSVGFDPTGREPGRGTYACSVECLERALSAGKLKRALRVSITEEQAGKLVSDMKEAGVPAARG